MSPFFDDLEDQLRSAARVQAGADDVAPSRRPRRSWLHAGLGAAPVVAAILVVLVVVGGALLLLGHRGGHGSQAPASPPASGGVNALIARTPKRQLDRELAYMAAATRKPLRSRTCAVHQPNGVSVVHGSPGAGLTSVLGVLRRAQTPADHLRPAALAGTPDVYAGHTRLALSADGVSYFIVPARYDAAASLPSARCFDLQRSALRAYLANITPSLRQPTLALQAGLIKVGRRLATDAPRSTICLVTASGDSGGADCGITAAEIKRGVPASYGQGTFSGIVPDGVASVTLRFRTAPGSPAHSVTGAVRGNVYAVHLANAPSVPVIPTVIWRSADGHVLKVVPAPRPQTVTSACRHNPAECLVATAASVVTSSVSRSGAAFYGVEGQPGP